jgi:AraC-like DNA-binding protein
VDVLQEHLIRARASGGLFAHATATPPWGLRLRGTTPLSIHAVLEDRAWLWFDGAEQEAMELFRGDLVLVKGGPDHLMAHEPGADCIGAQQFLLEHAADSTKGRHVVLLCGSYRFDGDIGKGLVEALPPVVRLTAESDEPIHEVIALLVREMRQNSLGKQTVLDRLLDVVVVLGIRAGLALSPRQPSWFRAASDPRLAPVLQAMYAEPERPWTIESLAEAGAMSRSTLARAFQQTLGQSPIAHLAEWRMAVARDSLLGSDASLAEIARTVGYNSEYAFATAFRRHNGDSPGRWRQRVRVESGRSGQASLIFSHVE